MEDAYYYYELYKKKLVVHRQMVSGRSKPPSVRCGIQLSAVPGRDPGVPSALFGLHPQGFTVPSVPAVTLNELGIAPPSGMVGLGRFIAGGRTCRFCVIAMTLAIPACTGLRA